MRGTSFRKGNRQQACCIPRANSRNSIALEYVVVNVVLSPADGMGLDSAGEAFRPQATVDLPLVEVGAFLPE